ncbi:thioredoxin family protein [Stieleria sp. ICT_E10.1]|uniref:thioredoxin family protein n=1 Tax=Stieleria sedimenti TaxID=2976331 RepID=UPI00217FD91A|nr:thioredoxin family protein [Stieleria sedimenti]MCS7465640.1 thioredoxin family protein [Stieleria sedimenti]
MNRSRATPALVFMAFVTVSQLAGHRVAGQAPDRQAPDRQAALPPIRLTIYAVEDLPVYRMGRSDDPVFDPSALVFALKTRVDPPSWLLDETDIKINLATKSLFIRQFHANHDEIANLLQRLRRFSRSIDKASLDATIEEARKTNRRVLLLVSRPESNFTANALAVLDDERFAKVSDHYLLRCITPERIDQLGGALGNLNSPDDSRLCVLAGNGDPIDQLTDQESRAHRDSITQFLRKHGVPLPTADTVLRAGQVRSDAEQKKTLLIVSGPGCVHCIRLKTFLSAYESIFSKDFVPVIVDTRMPDVESVTTRFGRTDDEIPWYAIIDSDGKPIVTSESTTGNIGFPADDEDRDYFRSMFDQTRRRISDAELDEVFRALRGGS